MKLGRFESKGDKGEVSFLVDTPTPRSTSYVGRAAFRIREQKVKTEFLDLLHCSSTNGLSHRKWDHDMKYETTIAVVNVHDVA